MAEVDVKSQAHQKTITPKDLISWSITLGVIFITYIGSLRISEAILNTKFNDFKETTLEKNKQYEERITKQDAKLDLIISGIHNIELQLKDKEDRK